MIIYLNKITDSFRPNRLIWQEVNSVEGFFKAVAEKQKAIKEGDEFCNSDVESTEEEGKKFKSDIKDKICSLREKDEYDKIKRYKTFIDELFVKFLVNGEGRENEKNSLMRLQILESELDMKTIFKCLEKASGKYELVPKNDPSKIVFTYESGEKEIINLELTLQQRINILVPLFGAIRRGLNRMRREEPEAVSKNQDNRRAEDNTTNPQYLIERSGTLNAPDLAYAELTLIAPSLDDDILRSLSDPLSRIADIWSRVKYNSESSDWPKLSDEDMAEYVILAQQVEAILKEGFPGLGEDKSTADLTREESEDLLNIAGTFGLDF